MPLHSQANLDTLSWNQYLVLDNGSRPVRVLAKPSGSPTRDGLEIEVSIAGVAPQAPPHYKAIACMGPRLPSAPGLEAFALKDVVSLPFSVEEMYRQWLFHGPLMAGIHEIKGIGTNGIAGDLMPSCPRGVSAERHRAPGSSTRWFWTVPCR